MYHRAHLALFTLWSKLFSQASANKVLACSARQDTCTKPAVPRHETRARALLRFQWRPACRSNTSGPSCRPRTPSPRPRRPPCTRIGIILSAPPARLIFLQSLSCHLLSSAAPGIQAHSSVLQRPHFLPRDRPRSAAQMHVVRIIFRERQPRRCEITCVLLGAQSRTYGY